MQTGLLALVCLIICSAGCQAPRPSRIPTSQAIQQAFDSGLTEPKYDDVLKSNVTPPVGWVADPLKQSDKSRHRVWISPTKNTAYGVIYFDLPFPVGTELTLSGFLKQMKATEGEANLISKKDDSRLPGIRFEAEGGLYRIRGNLSVDGFHGWVVYAGTIRAQPIDPAELKLAEQAREQTKVDVQ